MHAQNLLIDTCSKWQAIEGVAELLPEFNVVSALALVVEAIDPSN